MPWPYNVSIPVGIYLPKVSNRNTGIRCEICSKLTINFEHSSHLDFTWIRCSKLRHIVMFIKFLRANKKLTLVDLWNVTHPKVNLFIECWWNPESLERCPENFPRGKLPPFRVRVWFRISVRIRTDGQFSSGANFLEPLGPVCKMNPDLLQKLHLEIYSYNYLINTDLNNLNILFSLKIFDHC